MKYSQYYFWFSTYSQVISEQRLVLIGDHSIQYIGTFLCPLELLFGSPSWWHSSWQHYHWLLRGSHLCTMSHLWSDVPLTCSLMVLYLLDQLSGRLVLVTLREVLKLVKIHQFILWNDSLMVFIQYFGLNANKTVSTPLNWHNDDTYHSRPRQSRLISVQSCLSQCKCRCHHPSVEHLLSASFHHTEQLSKTK